MVRKVRIVGDNELGEKRFEISRSILYFTIHAHQINVSQLFSPENQRWSVDPLHRYDDLSIRGCLEKGFSARIPRLAGHATYTSQKHGRLSSII